MASRLPRLFQRVVYRHRRSINLLYNESRELARRLKVGCIEQPSLLARSTRHNNIFSNTKQVENQFQFTLDSKRNMSSTLSKSQKSCIEFETFNHPKIDLNAFSKNLKKFWNFEPTTKHKINKNHIEIMYVVAFFVNYVNVNIVFFCRMLDFEFSCCDDIMFLFVFYIVSLNMNQEVHVIPQLLLINYITQICLKTPKK